MITRNYNCSDAELLISADTMSLAYEGDQAAFIAFNSGTFSPTFKTDFDTAISTARSAANDEYYVDQQQQKTQNVENKMDLCRKAYHELIFAAKQAYEDEPLKWKIFGYDDYGKVGKSVNKMIEFMSVIHKGAESCSAKLISDGGYSQVKVDSLKTLGEQLKQAKAEQKDFINKRPDSTAARIDLHNKVYGIMQKINEAADNIYAGNDAKLKQYALPVSSSVTQEEETPTPTPSDPPAPNP